MVNLHYLVILNIIVIILTSLRCMRMDIEENAGMPKHEKKNGGIEEEDSNGYTTDLLLMAKMTVLRI